MGSRYQREDAGVDNAEVCRSIHQQVGAHHAPVLEGGHGGGAGRVELGAYAAVDPVAEEGGRGACRHAGRLEGRLELGQRGGGEEGIVELEGRDERRHVQGMAGPAGVDGWLRKWVRCGNSDRAAGERMHDGDCHAASVVIEDLIRWGNVL